MESNMSSIKAAAAAFDLPLVKDLHKNLQTNKGGSKTARSLNTTMRIGGVMGGAYATLEPAAEVLSGGGRSH
jgi:hypothetical protein